MFNPYSGKRLSNLLFIGPIFYQRLRHLVDDKMYARARGTVVALTRQPTHGRSRGGGLRFGEMERDCILSHGISKFLQERLFKVSDLFRIHVCSRCGLMAEVNLELNSVMCRYCVTKGVHLCLFPEKEGRQDLPGGDPLRRQAAAPGTHGHAHPPQTLLRLTNYQHLISMIKLNIIIPNAHHIPHITMAIVS